MKLSKAVAKAEKITGQKAVVANQVFYFTLNGYSISFMANGRIEDDNDAICFYTTKAKRTEDDMNSDYWPGTFHDNLTQAVKFISHR